MRKALLLFSGGLDSLLSGKIIQKQGIKVIPVTYITPFFNWKYYHNPEAFHQLCKNYGFDESILLDVTEEYLKILQKPKYGFGSHANPCIACKIFMMSKTKELLKETGADFVISGEVIGQRPKSQNRWAMEIIKNESNLDDLLVRPLSAKLLPPSLPERMGWVKREELFDLFGRNRKVQLQLAKEFGLENFSSPAGGCLLTDPQIGDRMLKVINEKRPLNSLTAQLAVLGRHVYNDSYWIVLGRNDEENKKIYKIAKNKLPLYILTEPSPLAAIIQGNPTEDEVKSLLIKYSKKAQAKINSGQSVSLIPPSEEEFGS